MLDIIKALKVIELKTKGLRAVLLKKKTIFLVAMIVVAVLLRAGNLGGFHPIDPDEKTWLQVGTSILSTGVPVSWTIHNNAYIAGGAKPGNPYLDHPPLFSLVVGSWAHLVGEADMKNLNWGLVRFPMIVISILTIIITYLLVRRVFGELMAVFTLLAYVFFPSHVIVSRIVAAENFIGLLLVFGLYLLVVFDETKSEKIKKLALIGLLLLCVVSLLIKMSAVIIPASLVFIAFYMRKYLLGILLSMATVVSGVFLLAYGFYYNWEVFLNVLSANHNRSQNFAHFWSVFTQLNIGGFSMYDAAIIVGFIGAINLTLRYEKSKKGLYVFVPLLIFSFLFLYVAPVEYYGWYKYAMYPFIAIGMGFVFMQLFKEKKGYLILFIPWISLLLRNNLILENQADRKIMMTIFYLLVTAALLINKGIFRLKYVFLALLPLLLFFEAVWIGKILDYKWVEIF